MCGILWKLNKSNNQSVPYYEKQNKSNKQSVAYYEKTNYMK